MGRRSLLAANVVKEESGGDVYLTMNATTDENKRAYEVMTKESAFDGSYYDWFPGNTNIFISGVAEGKTFTNVPVTWATMHKDSTLFDVYFDGRGDLGITPVAWLHPNGTFEVFDDD